MLRNKEGSTVTVNWEGKKIQAEIVAVDGKSNKRYIGNWLLNIRWFKNFNFNQKDVEWSSKFVATSEPSPSSNQSDLPAEKKKTRQQPRKTQVDSSALTR